MGLFDQIGAAFGGGENLQRFAGGGGNFEDPNSPDHQHLQSMIAKADQSTLQKVFTGVIRQINPQDYAGYLTQGTGGRSPLSALGSGGLATIAGLIVKYLGGSGSNISSLIPKIPGLKTSDPNQMDEHQVASLATYTQQNHPDVLGQVAAHLGKENPSMLSALLPKGGMGSIASGLASQFLGR